MYEKNLKHQIVLRLSEKDYNFLAMMSEFRDMSMSRLVRDIIGDYRRSYVDCEVVEYDG